MQVLICEWGPEKNLVKGKPLKQFGLPKEGHTVFFYDSSWFSTVKLSILAANKNPSAYFCLLRLLLAILVDTPSCSTAIAILSAAAAAAASGRAVSPAHGGHAAGGRAAPDPGGVACGQVASTNLCTRVQSRSSQLSCARAPARCSPGSDTAVCAARHLRARSSFLSAPAADVEPMQTALLNYAANFTHWKKTAEARPACPQPSPHPPAHAHRY